ncbi:ABC transporter ATP-binding protein [bacterium]|nr:ABC transporter ATP-binding protein [bacterium]MBQ9149565.1 ABC transporter ATP-binding protein [bacterium]
MTTPLFKQIVDMFYEKDKYKFYLLFLFSLIAGLFEYMGLILIFQFVLFLSNPNTKYCAEIIKFFNNNFNITENAQISLILGISIASVYILKNIYMLIFIHFNNKILEDLSVKMTLKTVKCMLFADYLSVAKISCEDKIALLSKNEFIVWQYCYKYVNLIVNCAIAAILIFYLFAKFTLPALIAVVFVSILSFVEYKYLKKHSTYQNKHFSSCFDILNSILIKTINSIKEIKLNNKEEFYINKIKQSAYEYAILNKNRSFCSIFHIYFTEISVMFTFMVVLGVLFYTLNFDNQLLITSISTICVIILRLTPLINRAQSCLYSINSNKSLVIELLDFCNKFFSNITIETTNEILPFEKKIELKNINFNYGNNDSGLKDINLTINKGEFIGIVGKSGCYKTTLSLILAGLIKPKSGEILVDDKKILKNDYAKWQNNISLLGQDYCILCEELNEINSIYLQKLGLNISKELLIENLSYGEKHRLAIANLLSKDKNVFILDEISSSCDVISENKISDLLLEMKGRKTIISIAHRLQTLKHCDRIVFMDSGKIIDIGTFKELCERHKDFEKIVELSNFKLN